jgi:hypothetical protein
MLKGVTHEYLDSLKDCAPLRPAIVVHELELTDYLSYVN